MPKILCLLENAATEINGIKFIKNPDGDGLISELDVVDPHLEIFAGIDGYSVVETEPVVEKKATETAAQRKARLAKEAQDQADADAAAAAAVATQTEPVVEDVVTTDPVVEKPADESSVF